MKLTISDLYDLDHTLAANYLRQFTYPWEALAGPPINPENIQKAFQEPTAENWKEAFAEVNAFIRQEPHIDVAAPFEDMEELPTWLALDGLHGDWNMKQMMAQVINEEMEKVRAGV